MLREQVDYLAPDAVASLRRYALDGVPTGGCLRAALCNDFADFFARADPLYAAYGRGIAMYIYNELPGNCWRSEENVDNWIASGGINGQRAAALAEEGGGS